MPGSETRDSQELEGFLRKYCSTDSDTLEKIHGLPNQFKIAANMRSATFDCFVLASDKMSDFEEKLEAIKKRFRSPAIKVVNANKFLVIKFRSKLDAFRFMNQMSENRPLLDRNCIFEVHAEEDITVTAGRDNAKPAYLPGDELLAMKHSLSEAKSPQKDFDSAKAAEVHER